MKGDSASDSAHWRERPLSKCMVSMHFGERIKTQNLTLKCQFLSGYSFYQYGSWKRLDNTPNWILFFSLSSTKATLAKSFVFFFVILSYPSSQVPRTFLPKLLSCTVFPTAFALDCVLYIDLDADSSRLWSRG